MSTSNLNRGKGRQALEADITAICEPTVNKMWELRCLTTLWASTACYRDIFTFCNRLCSDLTRNAPLGFRGLLQRFTCTFVATGLTNGVQLYVIRTNYSFCQEVRPSLRSSGQTSRLQTQRSRVRFPALPDFLSSSGSVV
jgi:hypothetical protein